MAPKLIHKLIKKHPKIFPKKILDDPLFDISCMDGWYQVIDDLCGQIQERVDADPGKMSQATIPYIKEKFGMLSLSLSGGDDSIIRLIQAATDRSKRVCEICGSTEKVQRTKKESIVKTLCEACRIKRKFKPIP